MKLMRTAPFTLVGLCLLLSALPASGGERVQRSHPHPADSPLKLAQNTAPSARADKLTTAARLIEQKQYEAAVGVYKEYLADHPDDLEVKLLLAQALRFAKQFDEANRLHTEIRTAHPDHTDNLTGQGFLFLALGDFDRALANFKRVLELSPDYADARDGLNRAERGLQRNAQNRFIRMRLNEAEGFIQSGNFENAIRVYQNTLTRYPDHFETRFLLARAYRFYRQPAEALAIYNELLGVHPENADIWTARGQVHFQSDRWDLARQDFERALKLNPQDSDAARGLEKMKRFKSAHALSEKISELEAEGEYAQAKDLLVKALAADPDNADLQFKLAQNRVKQGKPEEALELYIVLVERYPGNTDYWVGRALVHRLLKKNNEARDDYAQALKIQPGLTDAELGLGMLAFKQREYFESERYYQNVLDRDPENIYARQGLRDLENYVRDQVIIETVVETFSGDRDSRETYRGEVIHPFSERFRGIVGGQTVRQSGLNDVGGYFGVNADLSATTHIGLQAEITPNAELIAEQLYETEITQAFFDWPVELLLSYRFMKFETVDFNLVSPGFLWYLGEKVELTARGYLGLQSGGTSHAGYVKLQYRFHPALSAYVGGAMGDESFRLVTQDVTQSVDTHSILGGMTWRIMDEASLRFYYEYEDREGQFRRNVFGGIIFLRF